jgi:type I restriction enzyme S subunit
MVPDPVDFCIAQDMVAIRASEEKVYSKYLLAILRSNRVQKDIETLHVGTMIPHFKKGDFDRLLLPLPERRIQEFIGDCYYDFSAKIEQNRRMNETLEAMARAIFKSWFVDFDPVRAKAEGRQPEGMDTETAALLEKSGFTLFDESFKMGCALQAVDQPEADIGQAPLLKPQP